jgi:hypothetical protein
VSVLAGDDPVELLPDEPVDPHVDRRGNLDANLSPAEETDTAVVMPDKNDPVVAVTLELLALPSGVRRCNPNRGSEQRRLIDRPDLQRLEHWLPAAEAGSTSSREE